MDCSNQIIKFCKPSSKLKLLILFILNIIYNILLILKDWLEGLIRYFTVWLFFRIVFDSFKDHFPVQAGLSILWGKEIPNDDAYQYAKLSIAFIEGHGRIIKVITDGMDSKILSLILIYLFVFFFKI